MERAYHQDKVLRQRHVKMAEIIQNQGERHHENTWVHGNFVLVKMKDEDETHDMIFNQNEAWTVSLYTLNQFQKYGDVFSVWMHLIERKQFMRFSAKMIEEYSEGV